MAVSQRKFCILDRQHKYTLSIEYDRPQVQWGPMPVLYWGLTLTPYYKETSTMTSRFKTVEEAMVHIKEIERKQANVEKYIRSVMKE
jgi:hypothetical protein